MLFCYAMSSVHRQPGKKNWFCAYRDGEGKQHFVSTGTTSKKDAIIICRAREKAARLTKAGKFNTDEARRLITEAMADMMLRAGAELPSSTSKAWFARWLETKSIDTAQSTADRYGLAIRDFEAFLRDKAGLDLGQITREDVLAYRDATAKRLSPGTANTNLRVVRSCLGDAALLELIPKNVASRIPFAREGTSKRRPFTAEELRRLVQACGQTEWRGMVLCGLYTGQRLNDVASLRWGQIDLTAKLIRFETRKTGVRLEMHLAKPLLDYFEALPSADDPADYVFPTAAHRTNLSDDFYREVLTPAGLVTPRAKKSESTGRGRRGKRAATPITFHSLRHNFVTWLKKTGATEAVAQMIVGHESAEVSRHYTHLTAADAQGYIDKLPEVE